MARNGRNKKIYLIAITIYLFVVVISLLICFLLEAPEYTYAAVPFGISIVFFVTFSISCYDILNRIDPDDIEEIKKISASIEVNTFEEKLKIKGFEQLDGQIFFKTYNDKKRKFNRYIFLTEIKTFDLGLEQFLLKLQDIESIDKTQYFEAYIIMLPYTVEYTAEIQKESRANNYTFSAVNFSIHDKLFKCLIYNENECVLHYNKINIFPRSLDAVDFIEKVIAEVVSA